MKNILRRRTPQARVNQPKRRSLLLKRALAASGIVLAILVIINLGMMIAYRSRVLPHYSLGQVPIGNTSFAALQQMKVGDIVPAHVTLAKGQTTKAVTPDDLGIGLDYTATLHSLKTSWLRWLPLISLASHHHAALRLSINSVKAAQATTQIAATFNVPSQPPHIVFQGSSFVIAPAQTGYTLNTTAFMSTVAAALQAGKTQLEIPTVALAASPAGPDLTPQLQQLQKQLTVKLSFVYQGKKITPSAADIGGWFAGSGQGMAISDAHIAAYINTLGQSKNATIANKDDLATAVEYAMSKQQPLSLVLVPATSATIVRTYCTAVRGVGSSVLAELEGKLAATYADARGWNDGGQIAFEHVDSGCQYTVWMAASSQMTGFGAICDDYYNCQIGTNVVMNYDRWTGATPPWNQTGGTLEDYHTLMIDHETGHRLGFLDNPTCPGVGQPAPVMMQQSIDLKGCVFNIWPRPAEFTQLAAALGLDPTITSVQE